MLRPVFTTAALSLMTLSAAAAAPSNLEKNSNVVQTASGGLNYIQLRKAHFDCLSPLPTTYSPATG
jgi:hypothetical protein